MSLALVGLNVPGVVISDPDCTGEDVSQASSTICESCVAREPAGWIQGGCAVETTRPCDWHSP